MKELDGRLFGLGVDADVGDGILPFLAADVGVGEGNDGQAVEEIFLDVTDAVFDAAFFVGFADVAGGDGEAVMGGEIEVAGMKDDRAMSGMFKDGGFAVIDDDTLGDTAEESEGVFLAGKEVFETLFEGEFEVEHAAVAEDHVSGVATTWLTP